MGGYDRSSSNSGSGSDTSAGARPVFLTHFSLCLSLPSLSCRPVSICSWTNGLTVKSAVAHARSNEETLKTLLDLAAQYHKRLEEAEGKTAEELVVANVVGARTERRAADLAGRRGCGGHGRCIVDPAWRTLTDCSHRSVSVGRPSTVRVCALFFFIVVQGRIDPKKHLEMHVDQLMTSNITQTLGLMLDTVLF